MKEMREIGRRIKAEQGLTSEDIAWLVRMVKAVLRAFVWDVRHKRAFFGSRFVRFHSELLVLGLVFAGGALVLALHLPLRAYLSTIYWAFFEYLVPFLVFFGKAMLLSFVVLWWRWTLPRLRVDQLMGVCWKYLIPIGFVCLVGQGFWMWLFS